MRSKNDYSQWVAVLFLVAAIALRFVPHPANFAPVAALGLFAGCYLRGWAAWLLPVGAMVASDWLGHVLQVPGMGFYSTIGMAFVYGGFALASIFGYVLRGRDRVAPIMGAAVANSLVFFLVSNFGAYLAYESDYERSWWGLLQCYYAALPFYGNSILGDVFFSALFFGGYQYLMRSVGAEAGESSKA